MEVKKYVEAIKELQKEGISEQIVIKVLEEWGKDRRTYMMESGKDKRVGSYPQKQEKTSQTSSDGVTGITEKQLKMILKWSQKDKGRDFLKEYNIVTEDDALKLSKRKASEIISEGIKRQ